jgi:hypothetical protein
MPYFVRPKNSINSIANKHIETINTADTWTIEGIDLLVKVKWSILFPQHDYKNLRNGMIECLKGIDTFTESKCS